MALEKGAEVSVGVVGTGRIAELHLKNMSNIAGLKLRAVSDVVPERAEEVASKYSATPYTDFREMIAGEKLDAVLICTPPTVRLDAVKAAAERSVAVFIEKPPAADVAKATETLRVIKDSGIINSVGFMYRWSKAIDFLKELIVDEPINLIRSIFLNGPVLDPKQPKWFFDKSLSGGPVLDQAIHMLDLTRYIAGDVKTVHAFGANVVAPKTEDFTVEDSVTINLRYKTGAIQTHVHSWSYPDFKLEIELVSDRHHLYVSPEQLHGTINGDEISYKPASNDYYHRELVGFFQAVRDNDQSLIRSPYSDAIKTLETVLASNESIDENKLVELGQV